MIHAVRSGAIDQELQNLLRPVFGTEAADRVAAVLDLRRHDIVTIRLGARAIDVEIVPLEKPGSSANELLYLVTLTEKTGRAAESPLSGEGLTTFSHELRNPLTVTMGWLSVLRDPHCSVEKRELGLAALERATQIQLRLVSDLLDVAGVEAGTRALVRAPTDLAAVVDSVLAALHPFAAAKRVTTSLENEGGRHVVLGDVDRLHQVIGNIVSNAIKFTPEGGRIRLYLARHGERVRLRIVDNGIGFATDFQSHIFSRFAQAGTQSRTPSGVGIGLSIVRRLVELHGGTVSAESGGVGLGASFTVELPVLEVDSIPSPVASRSAASNSDRADAPLLEGVSVLVVDDDDDIGELLRLGLEKHGAVVHVASSAREALSVFKSARPDILVSDIGMPEEDGITLLRAIRSLGDDAGGYIPAVALTGYSSAEVTSEALLAGYAICLVKPASSDDVANAVRKLFRRLSKARSSD